MAGWKPVVLLVESNATLRGAVARRLSQRLPIVVREASSGISAINLARQMKPAVVVLDLSLPDQSGLAVITELRVAWPRTNVIALASHPDSEYVEAAMRAGALDCFPREEMAAWIELAIVGALPVRVGWLAWLGLQREALARQMASVSPRSHWQTGVERVSGVMSWLDRHGPWQDQPRTRWLYAANVVGVAVMASMSSGGVVG